jgi:hypothetical protein
MNISRIAAALVGACLALVLGMGTANAAPSTTAGVASPGSTCC